MYNRYIRRDTGVYERINAEEPPPFDSPGYGEGPPPPFGGNPPPPGGGNRGKGIFSGLLEKLNLKDIDTGDLLLLLLIVLLFREGEDEELLIALALLLIL